METKIVEQLKQINKEAIVKKSFYSYTTFISDALLNKEGLFESVCLNHGINEEDLLQILKQPSYANISLLDELAMSIVNNNYKKHF